MCPPLMLQGKARLTPHRSHILPISTEGSRASLQGGRTAPPFLATQDLPSPARTIPTSGSGARHSQVAVPYHCRATVWRWCPSSTGTVPSHIPAFPPAQSIPFPLVAMQALLLLLLQIRVGLGRLKGCRKAGMSLSNLSCPVPQPHLALGDVKVHGLLLSCTDPQVSIKSSLLEEAERPGESAEDVQAHSFTSESNGEGKHCFIESNCSHSPAPVDTHASCLESD